MRSHHSGPPHSESVILKIRKTAGSLFNSLVREQFQARRANLFIDLMQPRDDTSILDLGGGTGHFLARIKDRVQARFVVADIESRYASVVQQQHGLEFVLLEENAPLPFSDAEFDIVFSNSVIEHVTLPKALCSTRMPQREWLSRSWERQRQFADEIRRVGKAYFVQTPHRGFPIETHIWLPFANWLNHNHTLTLVQLTNKYWIRRCRRVDWNLLGCEELQALFPEAHVYVERIVGIPKSLVAYHSAAKL